CALLAVGFGGLALSRQWSSATVTEVKQILLWQTPSSPYATTDAYLQLLGIQLSSKRVIKIFSEIPQSDGVVFIGSIEEPHFHLGYQVFSYLSWPHKLGALDCSKQNASEGLFYPRSDPGKIRWLIYYRKPPREIETSTRTLSPNLWLVPVKELQDWN